MKQIIFPRHPSQLFKALMEEVVLVVVAAGGGGLRCSLVQFVKVCGALTNLKFIGVAARPLGSSSGA